MSRKESYHCDLCDTPNDEQAEFRHEIMIVENGSTTESYHTCLNCLTLFSELVVEVKLKNK